MSKRKIVITDAPIEAESDQSVVTAETRNVDHIGGGQVFHDSVTQLVVRNCRACHGDHDDIPELANTEPSTDTFGVSANHYYICPTTGFKVNIQHAEAV